MSVFPKVLFVKSEEENDERYFIAADEYAVLVDDEPVAIAEYRLVRVGTVETTHTFKENE